MALSATPNGLVNEEHTLHELRNLHRSLKAAGILCIAAPPGHGGFAYKSYRITYRLSLILPTHLGSLFNYAAFSAVEASLLRSSSCLAIE